MKQRLFCLWLLLLAAVGLSAYDFRYGDLYYNITSNSTVEVTWYSNNYVGLTSANIPASIEYSGKNYSVTSIGDWAFSGCTGLTSITIPNSVTSIGDKAFCGCTGLTSITIPNSVTSIGGFAFSVCSGLTSIIVESENSIFDSRDNCNAIIETATNTLIAGCKNTTIPNSVTSIGDGVFQGCSGLTSITIPNSVTSIGYMAFQGCGLTSITIPNSVTSIGYMAFQVCTRLTSIIVENENSKYDSRDNCNAIIETSSNTLIVGCKATTIPEGVTSIGAYAFAMWRGLTSITIPNSVTSIEEYAFYGCSGLISITIPNSVTSIGGSAFSGCSGLTSVTIGNSVTSIGDGAFQGCSGLTSITIGNSVTSIGESFSADCYKNVRNFTCKNPDIEIPNGAIAWFSQDVLDTIVMPANGFDVSEEKWANLPKYLKYAKLTSGEMTDNVFSVLNRSYKTLQTLDIQAVSNTSIADEAFKGCYNLRTLLLPSQLTKIPYMAVADCKSLQEITIPATVEEIDNSAFENCRSIQTITFAGADAPQGIAQYAPASGCALHRIGNWAFYNCHELQHLTIPEGVTEIGDAAFYGCTYLQDLTLPASVEQIGDNCFALCSKLQKITVLSTTPPAIAAKTFYDVNRAIPVYVPAESVADYQGDTYWKEFNIQADTTPIDHTQADKTASATPHKVVRDGQVLIIRGDKTYTATGIEVR